jgi:hypothetical protein
MGEDEMIDDNYSHGMQPSKCYATTMDRLADRSCLLGREVDTLIGSGSHYGPGKYRREGTVEYFADGPGGAVYLGNMEWLVVESTNECIMIEDVIGCMCMSVPSIKTIKILRIVLSKLAFMGLSDRTDWARKTMEDIDG